LVRQSWCCIAAAALQHPVARGACRRSASQWVYTAGPGTAPRPAPPCLDLMNSTGLTLGTVLLAVSGLFCLATLFFGTKGGYYDTDAYDGNGTAH